jgi:cysteine synthase A
MALTRGGSCAGSSRFLSSPKKILDSVCEGIGNTPMVRLRRVIGEDCKAARVLLKLEMQNPGGSVKDRIGLSMIKAAERRGEIHPGRTTIVEATSGNTGIALAMIAASRGYKCIITMPQVPSMYERYIIARKFGANVHLTAVSEHDFGGSIEMLLAYTKDLVAKNPDFWSPSQFQSEDNPVAHFEGTGPEIWDQTDGEIDVFVAGAGTGGTINGVSRFLKEKNPDCRIICVEPTESRVLIGEPSSIHGVTGIGAGISLPLLQELDPEKPWAPGPRGTIDEFLHASTPESIHWANRVAAEEGLLVAPSSGAAIKVAIDVAMRPEMEGKTVVALQASSAIRYVSHPMWEATRKEGQAALPIPPDLESTDPVCRWRSEDYVPPSA